MTNLSIDKKDHGVVKLGNGRILKGYFLLYMCYDYCYCRYYCYVVVVVEIYMNQ